MSSSSSNTSVFYSSATEIAVNFLDWMNTGLANAMLKKISFVCLCAVGILAFRLLLLARFRPAVLRVPELSRALVTYLCFHTVGAAISLPYNAFVMLAFYFDTADARHSAGTIYTVYWLGQWQNSYTLISPLAVLFLTIERCFIIKLATNPTKQARVERHLSWVGIGTILAAYSASTFIYIDELPLNITNLQLNGCESFSCLVLKWGNMPQLFFKCTISILNIVCCVYFMRSLHSVNVLLKMNNCMIIVTICFELCLNFVPALVSIGFKYFGTGLLSNLSSTCAVLDALCCTTYYSLVLVPPGWLKWRANNVIFLKSKSTISNGIGGARKPTTAQQQHHRHNTQQQQLSTFCNNTNSNLAFVPVPAFGTVTPLDAWTADERWF
ncbi:hypothetical protein niasHT_000244 [Heterodera trifolii]|uniref:G-protein coupled receptors family 1 profile domain-containing protein n=1 Tax=Heterodera trifolii TaxID=157864 RepID=A0ABD2LYD4_9BILA